MSKTNYEDDSQFPQNLRACVSLEVSRTIKTKAAFQGKFDYELSFAQGAVLEVLCDDDTEWWWCRYGDTEGYAPVNHLMLDSGRCEDDAAISWQDDLYFGRYSAVQYHLEMLLDKARTNAYLNAIKTNARELSGLTVLDVGCGSGILSMLCAKESKVHHVFAVDASSMANLACRAVKENGYENRISVLFGKVEGIEMDQEKVDLIISEWMGTLLISECMFESVLVARDRMLRKGGRVWPTVSSLFMAPCTAQSSYDSVSPDHWNQMYGLDFSVFKPAAVNELLEKPFHKHIANPDDLLSSSHTLLEIDLESVTVSDLEVNESCFNFYVIKNGVFHGFCTWFSVAFHPIKEANSCENDKPKNDIVVLNTGPHGHKTHWNHPLLLLDKPIYVKQGMLITGKVILFRHPQYRRHVRLKLDGEIRSLGGEVNETIGKFSKEYKCWQ